MGRRYFKIQRRHFGGDFLRHPGGQSGVARVCGSKGTLTIEKPWFASWGAGKTKIVFQKHWSGKPREIWVKSGRGLYAIEADEVGRCLQKGLLQSPAMSWADSVGNAEVLDSWLKA